MTVAIDSIRTDYTGNGATVDFPTTWKFLANEHVVVSTSVDGTNYSVLAEGVDYTVAGAGVDAGGTVTFLTAPLDGLHVRLERSLPILQETAFTAQGTFSARTHEQALDYRAMVEQQLEAAIAENTASMAGIQTLADNLDGAGLYLSNAGVGPLNVGVGTGLTIEDDLVRVDLPDLGDFFGGNGLTNGVGTLDVASYQVPENSVATLEVHVRQIRSDGADAGGYKLGATFRRLTGNATQVGSTTTLWSHQDSAHAVALVVSGSNVIVRCTGVILAIIAWQASGRAFSTPLST